jgi:hypothetical protein
MARKTKSSTLAVVPSEEPETVSAGESDGQILSGLGETPEVLEKKAIDAAQALARSFGVKTLTKEQIEAAYQFGIVNKRWRRMQRRLK